MEWHEVRCWRQGRRGAPASGRASLRPPGRRREPMQRVRLHARSALGTDRRDSWRDSGGRFSRTPRRARGRSPVEATTLWAPATGSCAPSGGRTGEGRSLRSSDVRVGRRPLAPKGEGASSDARLQAGPEAPLAQHGGLSEAQWGPGDASREGSWSSKPHSEWTQFRGQVSGRCLGIQRRDGSLPRGSRDGFGDAALSPQAACVPCQGRESTGPHPFGWARRASAGVVQCPAACRCEGCRPWMVGVAVKEDHSRARSRVAAKIQGAIRGSHHVLDPVCGSRQGLAPAPSLQTPGAPA
jgi:hypothetical protein